MEIPAAFDLLGSFHAAADLVGCSHHTVARLVAERDAGGTAPRTSRPRLVDEFLPKIEEWVEQSKGRIRADVAHDKLEVMGFTGSERSSRRAVAQVKKQYRLGNARIHRPRVTEPRAVAAVRLRRRPGHRRGQDGADLRVAGLVQVPDGHPVRNENDQARTALDSAGDVSFAVRLMGTVPSP
jgi:hypothetical protein